MSLAPTREDEAFGAGYRQASEAGGRIIDRLSHRLRQVEEERDKIKEAVRALHRVWWSGADVDKDAVTAACLSLFAVALVPRPDSASTASTHQRNPVTPSKD